jgi:hypothetical protein
MMALDTVPEVEIDDFKIRNDHHNDNFSFLDQFINMGLSVGR